MTSLARLIDWDARLGAFLAGLADATFGYDHVDDPSRYDCCTLAAGAVIALTGVDAMAEFRGHYRTERGALLALRRIGAGSVVATLDAKFPQVRPVFAHRGDLVGVPAGADVMLGICIGADAMFVGREDVFGTGREGLIRLPRRDWSVCWGIG